MKCPICKATMDKVNQDDDTDKDWGELAYFAVDDDKAIIYKCDCGAILIHPKGA